MGALHTTPFRSAPLSPPSPPPERWALRSLVCLAAVGATGLFCAPVFVQWYARPMLAVGGVALAVTLLWKRRRALRSALAAGLLAFCLLPPAERALDRSIRREVGEVRVAARRFRAERGRWPTGFAELRGLRTVHACGHGSSVNCLEWVDRGRLGRPDAPPFLVRYLYPAFARVIYQVDSDRERFID